MRKRIKKPIKEHAIESLANKGKNLKEQQKKLSLSVGYEKVHTMRLSKIALALPAAALLFAVPAIAEAGPAGLRTKASPVQTVAQKKMKATKATSKSAKQKPKGGGY